MPKKTTFLLLLAIFAGSVILAGCAKKTSQPENAQPQTPQASPAPTPAPAPEPTQPAQSPQTATPTAQAKSIDESTDSTTIKVSYPQLQGVANAQAQTDANAQLKAFADKQVSDFKKSIQSNSVKVPGAKNTLNVSYEVTDLTSSLFSAQFDIESFVSGAANPSNDTTGFNYDLKNDKALALTDIFNTGSDYLGMLSKTTYDKLKSGKSADSLFDDKTLKQALLPKKENFSDFTLNQTGMTILLAPYSVAPAVAGPQSVTIPYQEMTSDLNSNFLALING